MNNVSKLEQVVEYIKITTKGKPECDICVQGKIFNVSISKQRAGQIVVQLLSSGWSIGTKQIFYIFRESKEGYKYADCAIC